MNKIDLRYVDMNGRHYECVKKPKNDTDYGEWLFLYNGTWLMVQSNAVIARLNQKSGYWPKDRSEIHFNK